MASHNGTDTDEARRKEELMYDVFGNSDDEEDEEFVNSLKSGAVSKALAAPSADEQQDDAGGADQAADDGHKGGKKRGRKPKSDAGAKKSSRKKKKKAAERDDDDDADDDDDDDDDDDANDILNDEDDDGDFGLDDDAEAKERLEKIVSRKKQKREKDRERKKRRRSEAAGIKDGDDDDEASGIAGDDIDLAPKPKRRRRAAEEAQIKRRRGMGSDDADIEQHLQVVRPFIKKMEDAYIEDCKAVTEKRPATKKLTLLPEVSKTLQMRIYRNAFAMEGNYLIDVMTKWLAPLPNGALANSAIRFTILELLQRSLQWPEIGHAATEKVESVLSECLDHPHETAQNKRVAQTILDQLARERFGLADTYEDHLHDDPEDLDIIEPQESSTGESFKRQSAISFQAKGGARKLHPALSRIPKPAPLDYTIRPTSQLREVSIEGESEAQKAIRQRLLSKARR